MEFNTAEEINKKAAELLAARASKEIISLAVENGLDEDDAKDYIDGTLDTLTTPTLAALGRISIQKKTVDVYEITDDWIEYIKIRCVESEDMANAVMKKDKNLKECIAALLKWSLNNAKPVDADVLKLCKITYKVTLGIPGMRTAKKIITDYYLGGDKK